MITSGFSGWTSMMMSQLLLRIAIGDSLADIDHVVLFMQENRAFDHYFGTMAGVRGFKDANLQINGGLPVWRQVADRGQTNDTDYVMPWYLNYLEGNWTEATQCMVAGSNGWYENHAAWNLGSNDHWAMNNTPWSIGFYKKKDLPTQWALAENYIVGDMYQESVVASTNPNRVSWISGSVNVPGSPQKPDQGGYPYIDNNEIPGCEREGINCYPLKWKTAAECYETAGVTWHVYQDADNFDDNPFAWFDQFIRAGTNTSLHKHGMNGSSLSSFYRHAADGTLPAVSYIIGPMELSEHPPYSPHDGAWLQDTIARAVINSPKYNKTALFISYDETGGWFDHVNPYHSPSGTPGEWLDDPWSQVGHTFAGPGFRLPFYIVSPWTRNGGVFTEHADHSSQIQFIEAWQAAKGRNVQTTEMVPWRREHMSDLVAAFDFQNPDYSIPNLPDAPEPHVDSQGQFDGSAYCQSRYSITRPPVPYTGFGVIDDPATVAEIGFKRIRGQLTEGRYLVLQSGDYSLSNTAKESSKGMTASESTEDHELPNQRWIAHAQQIGGNIFSLQSAVDGSYVCENGTLCTELENSEMFIVQFVPSQGYSWKRKSEGDFVTVDNGSFRFSEPVSYWDIFSVSY